MKLLFLDIDGVANSTGSCLARTGTYWDASLGNEHETTEWTMQLLGMIGGEFAYGQVESFQTVDPTAVELINRLVHRSGAKVVLSSSHRSFFVGSNYESTFEFGSEHHLVALNLYMKLLGFSFELYGITPRLWKERGHEVAAFLKEQEDVERYVILDDGADFWADQDLLLIDPKLGFTGDDYFKAAKMLGTEESGLIV